MWCSFLFSFPVGPLCEYSTNPEASAMAMDCSSVLSDYEKLLTPPDPSCGDNANNNMFTWTPDENTPNTVFYQVNNFWSIYKSHFQTFTL